MGGGIELISPEVGKVRKSESKFLSTSTSTLTLTLTLTLTSNIGGWSASISNFLDDLFESL